jgi:hypothetical protein
LWSPGRRSIDLCPGVVKVGAMSVQVYGCNHLAIEVDDVKAAVKFYEDVFNLRS